MKYSIIILCVILQILSYQGYSQQISNAEYFFDTDPGIGNGIPIIITSTDSLNTILPVSTTGLTDGFHKIYFRLKDSNGSWSLYEGRSFYLQPEQQPVTTSIANAEYFFDTDPGVGNGTPISISPVDSINIISSISTVGLDAGFHKVYVRFMNSNNAWGLYEGRSFYLQPEQAGDTSAIIGMEYFMDTDPGPGNGTYIIITETDSVNQVFNIPLTEVDAGWHYVYLRLLDTKGAWSLTERAGFTIYKGYNIKAFLEGPFNCEGMNTLLNSSGTIPLNQPFNSSPWNYNGSESVDSIPNDSIVDWVLIEFRQIPQDTIALPDSNLIFRKALFILNNGNIVALDGFRMPEFTDTITQNIYAVVWHRNHLGIMSSGAMDGTSGNYVYNFTDDLAKAFGNGQKEIGTGIFGMIAGDSDANGVVDSVDKADYWNTETGKHGYLKPDLNLDAEVDNVDKNDYWLLNNGSGSLVPE